jgi:SAM-dependent methyltransferase
MSAEGATADPFLERLEAHARAARQRPPDAFSPSPPPGAPSGLAAAPPAPAPLQSLGGQLAFWQSPVARAAINRRVTGSPALAPEAYLAARHGPTLPVPNALSLRGGDARLEVALVEAGPCERVIGLDIDERRVESANSNVPAGLRERIRFQRGEIAQWSPSEPVGAILVRSVLHRQRDLEGILERMRSILAPGGLVFVDEFVGPSRFQWTEAQLKAINRLLACLPDEFLLDLSATDGRRKRSVGRPQPDDYAAANPDDAVRSDQVLACLDERFERVEVHLYGGALYHQFFTRIMGNFASRPELVNLVFEMDAMLTDTGVLSSDYVWGVWRRGGRV